MSGVFLDTVGLLGLWDEDDQWHGAATASFERMAQSRERLYTTSYVFAECANATARWIDRSQLAGFVRALEGSGGFVFPTENDWKLAWANYSAGVPGGPGLVDHLSFAVMQRLGLRQAFTNDRHFAAAGFEVLF